MNFKNVIKAYQLGQQFAKRIRIGKRFFGSMPIALKLYKQRECAEYDTFLLGFHSVLEDYDIWVSADTGLVTGFRLKEHKAC